MNIFTFYYLIPTTSYALFSAANSPYVSAKDDASSLRLPKSLSPTHYLVRLQPFINGNFSIKGHVEITFDVLEDTEKVILHISDIITCNETAQVHRLDGATRTSLTILQQEFDLEKQFYIATLRELLEKGKTCVISMCFVGYLNNDLKGFYRSSYVNDQNETVWIAGTQFEATDARKAFPCFDEPGLKANFTIELAREKMMTAISNMPLRETVPMKRNSSWVWDKFETTVPMSTYLVAFLISDFTFKKSLTNEVSYDFKVWARKSAIYQADYALKIGPRASKFFEDFFSVPFPLPKQDMVALPDFSAGAMENWGLITYRETSMLYDPKVSTTSNKVYIATVIVHELAHQWFGNLVTPSWWTDLWLNEGFATYMEYLCLNGIEPSFQKMEQFVIDELHTALALDCLESSHPISVEVQNPEQISENFDTISYSKGASIIRMMHNFLGNNTFIMGLSNYLKELAYSNAKQDDLWHYLTEQAFADGSMQSNMTVKSVMDTWTLQMGFPVITVIRINDGTTMLKQERFLLVKNENSTDMHDYKWWVPITFASKSNPDFSVTKPNEWMTPNDTTKVISGFPNDDWVIFNVQQTGYYRVNYDQANWNGIADQLIQDHNVIHPLNRAQILNDVFSLSRADLLSYETVMKVVSYLKEEEEYAPWRVALDGLNFMKKMFAQSGGNGALQKFILDLTIPIYNHFRFSELKTDPHLEQRKKSLILSQVCNLGYKPCVQEAVSLFNKWMQNPDNATIISPNHKRVVYCTAIKRGSLEEWSFTWGRYQKANLAAEKEIILSALGCTKETWILSRYMEKALTSDKEIRKQDVSSVIGSVANSDQGKVVAWEFFKENYDSIYEMFGDGSFTLGGIVKSVTNKFNSRTQLKELKEFQRENESKLGSAARAVEQAIETTMNNLNWMDNHYNTILKWLSDNGYENNMI